MKKFLMDVGVRVAAMGVFAVLGLLWTLTRPWASNMLVIPIWGLFLSIAIPASVAGAGGWWLASRRRKPSTHGAFGADAPSDSKFKPTPFQHEIIRVLRLADDNWVMLNVVAKNMSPTPPVSDVREALEALVAAGWASDLFSHAGREFRLKGFGMQYARDKAMPIGLLPVAPRRTL